MIKPVVLILVCVLVSGCRIPLSSEYGEWKAYDKERNLETKKLGEFTFAEEPSVKYRSEPTYKANPLPSIRFCLQEKVKVEKRIESGEKRQCTRHYHYIPFDRDHLARIKSWDSNLLVDLFTIPAYPILFSLRSFNPRETSWEYRNKNVDTDILYQDERSSYESSHTLQLVDFNRTIEFNGDECSIDLNDCYSGDEWTNIYNKLLKMDSLRVRFSLEDDVRSFDLSDFKNRHQQYVALKREHALELVQKERERLAEVQRRKELAIAREALARKREAELDRLRALYDSCISLKVSGKQYVLKSHKDGNDDSYIKVDLNEQYLQDPIWINSSLYEPIATNGSDREFVIGLEFYLPKTAMGAQEWIKEEKTCDLAGHLENKKADGYRIIAVETIAGSRPCHEYTWPEKGIIVMGNEEYGISPHVLAVADDAVHIPMFGKKNSLNVANALAAVLYQTVFFHMK